VALHLIARAPGGTGPQHHFASVRRFPQPSCIPWSSRLPSSSVLT